MNDWIVVAIVIGVALVAGSIAGRIVRGQLSKPSRPEAMQLIAVPASSLVFSTFLIVALMVALGIVDPKSLEDLPKQLINYLPKALSAGVVLLAGNAVSTLAASTISASMQSATGATAQRIGGIVKAAILAAAGILAATQLGVDTTIINLAAAALLFGIALSSSLLIGLGGRNVASQIAAGRAYRAIVDIGDRVAVGDLSGTVRAVHPVAIEIERRDGTRVVVPNNQMLDAKVLVDRPAPAPQQPSAPDDIAGIDDLDSVEDPGDLGGTEPDSADPDA